MAKDTNVANVETKDSLEKFVTEQPAVPVLTAAVNNLTLFTFTHVNLYGDVALV